MGVTDQSNPNAERKFVKSAMLAPLLDPDHERSLALRWRDEEDEAALHELTSAYVRLVISMANKFRRYGLPISDLIQEGNIGLMQAAARFDPAREVRFSTYASGWIRSCLQDFVLRNWSIVRTGTTAAQKALFFNLSRLRAKINDLSESSLSPENQAFIAQELGVPECDVERMVVRLSASDRSLNVPVGEGGEAEYQDLISDDSATPEEHFMDVHDGQARRRWIAEAMAVLNPRERQIIRARRLSEDSQTLESLGSELGISKERVRQIEHAALTKLKQALIRISGEPEESGIIPAV